MEQKSRHSFLLSRYLAKSIDLCVIFMLSLVLPHPVGVLLGLIYTIVHDGVFAGRSLGKKLFKLRVVVSENVQSESGEQTKDQSLPRRPCSLSRSAVRNAPFAVATFFGIIPFWGWILSIVVGVPMMAMEIYLMLTREKHERLGDVMAETQVISDPSSIF